MALNSHDCAGAGRLLFSGDAQLQRWDGDGDRDGDGDGDADA